MAGEGGADAAQPGSAPASPTVGRTGLPLLAERPPLLLLSDKEERDHD